MNRSYKSNKREKPVSPLMVYWRRLDKPLILAALLCSVLSIILLYSIWQNHIISSVGSSYYRTQLLSCGALGDRLPQTRPALVPVCSGGTGAHAADLYGVGTQACRCR